MGVQACRLPGLKRLPLKPLKPCKLCKSCSERHSLQNLTNSLFVRCAHSATGPSPKATTLDGEIYLSWQTRITTLAPPLQVQDCYSTEKSWFGPPSLSFNRDELHICTHVRKSSWVLTRLETHSTRTEWQVNPTTTDVSQQVGIHTSELGRAATSCSQP